MDYFTLINRMGELGPLVLATVQWKGATVTGVICGTSINSAHGSTITILPRERGTSELTVPISSVTHLSRLQQ